MKIKVYVAFKSLVEKIIDKGDFVEGVDNIDFFL